jgi:PAS domain S-box-containing protein
VNTVTQAVLFNAVPLLFLAALYLTVGVALVVALRREGGRVRDPGFATALAFPCVGAAAAILGVAVLIDREPIGGNALASFPAILLALVPAVAVARHWADRGLLASGVQRTKEAERRSSLRDQELERIGRLSHHLLDAEGVDQIARLLLDEITGLYGLDLANLVLVENDGDRARIVASREAGADNSLLIGQVLELDRESSGVGTVVRDGGAFAVYDAESSGVVSRRLNEIARVKSCAFVPMRSGEDVIGVVFAAVRQPRLFVDEELALMQTLAAEAGLALARARSAGALAGALERERLITRISQEVRSRRDLDDLLRVAVEETAKAARVDRCFIRLGEPGERQPVLAEWAPNADPLGDASRLPVSNLCAREARTILISDVLDAPELRDPSLGDLRELTDRGIRSVLATPIVASERVIGVLGFHRVVPVEWTADEVSLAKAVARETGIAIETSRLLRESSRRVAEHQALLKAGEALTSDLRFDVVIRRLVEQVQALVGADAVECWTMLPAGSELVCRAVLGLPTTELGRAAAPEGVLGEAIAAGRPVLHETADAEGERGRFAEVLAAPISSFGEIRGVLVVRSRERDRFDESDLRLIEAFASLASIALRNAEAFEESERQAQVERGFYRIAKVLSEPLSAEATFDAVAQAAAEALGGDSAAVLRAAAGNELELAGAHELGEDIAAYLSEDAAALMACARAGKLLASRRLGEDSRFGNGLARAAAAAGRRSLLAVPLSEPGGNEPGLVLVFFAGEEVFDEDQLELARHVAGAARGALERSELYERERRSRSLAQRLARAGRDLAGELDPDNVLDQTVRYAADLLGADGASARMLEGDEVVVRAAVGTGELEAIGVRAPSTGWLVGDIVQTRATRAIADVRDDARVLDADPMLAGGYAAYLGVPIVGPEDAVHGILAVYGRAVRDWSEEEADALHALAATAGAARSNAELYQGVSHEQQRSEAILANVADGIVAVDREGKVVLWNPAAERVTGVRAAEALGRTPAQVLGRPLEASEVLGASRLVSIRRGGDDAWLSLSEAVMTDPTGAVAGRIYAFRDISSERSVEQMKSDFVSTVSHELRTPLTSIYGFAETLLRQDVLFGEEERSTFLRYIASESERLTAIVDRLLSVAQLESGDMAVQLAETDVGAVVNAAVRSLESQNGEVGHRFVVELADEPLAAEADGEKLGQVLAHLLDNAVRYSPAGATVTVAARRHDDAVQVSVEDEGAGIPHADRDRIFRKFYRGDGGAAAVGTGATGLGLFLADGLVRAMGGRIWVDSDEGQGSTFVLELRAAATER